MDATYIRAEYGLLVGQQMSRVLTFVYYGSVIVYTDTSTVRNVYCVVRGVVSRRTVMKSRRLKHIMSNVHRVQCCRRHVATAADERLLCLATRKQIKLLLQIHMHLI